MLKIVIADDAEIEREGLVQNIRWADLGITVAGAAADGLEAWDLIEEYQPDIVLTDIKMPIRDGIELAKLVAATYPATKIIFFSGYEDFNFALEAIKSKVCEYVLKPYTLREITDALRKTAEQCRQEQEKSREELLLKHKFEETKPYLKEKLLKDIVYGLVRNEQVLQEMLRFLNIRPVHSSFTLMLFKTDERDNNSAHNPEQLETPMRAILDSLLEQRELAAYWRQSIVEVQTLFNFRDGEFLLLLNNEEARLRDKAELVSFGLKVKTSLEERIDTRVTVCVSNPVEQMLQIAGCYKEVREMLKVAPLLGRDKVIFYDDMNTPDTFNRMNKIVNNVKQIISVKYMEPITLKDIAGEVFISPNYLNSIFKKSTGKNMNKYLIEVRITKAMEQLNEADAVISRVSENVGYRNVAHFSTLFKKHTGLTPMEYRENSIRTQNKS
ncbi:response regulator [Paenibacillus spongiae]|uniref:Response regulator n=1 Tax=Paenibacillus spongiae TaxID=2909671 RepID=A0ABY5SHB5_9BACL|nr:response regulator [Paenibacillus spongiae]UVI33369.1 response regulator [Paenibacillus spongiae]